MTDDDFLHYAARAVAVEVSAGVVSREGLERLANTVVFAHETGRVDLRGDLDVVVDKMTKVFDAMDELDRR